MYIRPCLSQWRIQRGFHGFHGTPLFEGLLSKILSANVLCTLYVQTGAAHLSFTVAITHMYQEFDTREAYVHVYIETISEANERMKAKVCIAPSAAIGMVICYLHESTYFPAPYVNNQLLCSLFALKFFSLPAQQVDLVIGHLTFGISPQEYTRNDLRRSEIPNFPWWACPQTPL